MFVALLQVLFVLLRLYSLAIITRIVLSWVLSYSRRWQPGRGGAAALELLWTVTDPPIRALRRVIPPLRIGSVGVDLAGWVALVILYVLSLVVNGLIMNLGS